MDKKKRLITIGAILAVVLITVFCVVKIIDARNRAKAEAEYEQEKINAVMTALAPYIELYGFDDIVVNATNFPSVGVVSAVITSEKFGAASDETKLEFLADVEYYTDQIPFSSENRLMGYISDGGLSLHVISGEYSYMESVSSGGNSELRRATAQDAYSTSAYSPYKEVILSMETIHSLDVEQSLNELIGDNGGCEKCGAKGVPLTQGGYCKICVDVYYTDYFIDWDGQVSADRPW